MTMDEALQEALWSYRASSRNATSDQLRKQFIASLAASGYAVVPVEATMNMRGAGRQHFIEQSGGKQFLSTVNVADFWRAMLAAAQEDSHE